METRKRLFITFHGNGYKDEKCFISNKLWTNKKIVTCFKKTYFDEKITKFKKYLHVNL